MTTVTSCHFLLGETAKKAVGLSAISFFLAASSLAHPKKKDAATIPFAKPAPQYNFKKTLAIVFH